LLFQFLCRTLLAWATLTDSRLPVEFSLRLLEGLHERLTGLLLSLTDEQWQRGFIHPELRESPAGSDAKAEEAWRSAFSHDERGVITIERVLATYAWHGRHHVAHITSLRERHGWK